MAFGLPFLNTGVGRLAGNTIDTVGKALGNPFPDIGISEFLAPPRAQASGPAPVGHVQGTFSGPNQNATKAPLSSSAPNSSSASSGGASSVPQDSYLQQLSKMDRNPSQESEYQRLLAELNGGQDETNRLIDEAYGASANYLNQAEQALRADYPTILSEIDSQLASGQRTAERGKESTLGTVQEQELMAQQRNQNVLADARRLYDELIRGYGQRFGGASSAGQAATELASVERQRQQGRIQQDFGNTMRQIEQARTQVEQKFQDQLFQLEETKKTAVNEANRDFQNKLLQISQSRAQNEQAKAQARLQALQDLRNKVYQINLQNLQFQQTLQAQKQQAELSLQNYSSQLSGLGQGVQDTVGNFTPSVSTGLNINDAFNSGGLTLDSNLMGIRTSRDDELMGQIAPNRRTDLFA